MELFVHPHPPPKVRSKANTMVRFRRDENIKKERDNTTSIHTQREKIAYCRVLADTIAQWTGGQGGTKAWSQEGKRKRVCFESRSENPPVGCSLGRIITVLMRSFETGHNSKPVGQGSRAFFVCLFSSLLQCPLGTIFVQRYNIYTNLVVGVGVGALIKDLPAHSLCNMAYVTLGCQQGIFESMSVGKKFPVLDLPRP